MTAIELTPTCAAHEVLVEVCAALSAAERAAVAEAIGRLAEQAYDRGYQDGLRRARDVVAGRVTL